MSSYFIPLSEHFFTCNLLIFVHLPFGIRGTFMLTKLAFYLAHDSTGYLLKKKSCTVKIAFTVFDMPNSPLSLYSLTKMTFELYL